MYTSLGEFVWLLNASGIHCNLGKLSNLNHSGTPKAVWLFMFMYNVVKKIHSFYTEAKLS